MYFLPWFHRHSLYETKKKSFGISQGDHQAESSNGKAVVDPANENTLFMTY